LMSTTFAWFTAEVVLQRQCRRAGYWILLSFLVAEFLFYFGTQILGIANGYGLGRAVRLSGHARPGLAHS
jgi:hypothetical protein